jgi:hypothetical protein
MWYNPARMARRTVVTTLLVLMALQLVGGMLFASVCFEPCPDDGDDRSCPPVCSLCTSCTHAQQAVVQAATTRFAVAAEPHHFPLQAAPAPSQRAADIFHVPLAS